VLASKRKTKLQPKPWVSLFYVTETKVYNKYNDCRKFRKDLSLG